MNRAKNSNFVNIFLHILGLALCILPPVICTLSYFPLWLESGAEKTLAGGSVILLALSALSLLKLIKRCFDSPASYLVWLVAFILFLLLSKIAHEMTVISLVGFISNALGAVCFAIAKKKKEESDE